jgi:hypothetical protein
MTYPMKAAMMACFIYAFSLVGACIPAKGAESPNRATARAVILTVAQAVKEADAICAKFASDTHDTVVAKKCADAYDLARPSLMGAQSGVDAWDDATSSKVACIAIDSIAALSTFAGVLTDAKLALPPVIVDGLNLSEQFKVLCHG